eukprot:1081286-Pleurochrysis_carterae.AAC.2
MAERSARHVAACELVHAGRATACGSPSARACCSDCADSCESLSITPHGIWLRRRIAAACARAAVAVVCLAWRFKSRRRRWISSSCGTRREGSTDRLLGRRAEAMLTSRDARDCHRVGRRRLRRIEWVGCESAAP